MVDRDTLEGLFREHGFDDFKWIDAHDIVVSEWVRFRCMFGCPNYGKSGTCPPQVPAVEECRRMFSEFGSAVVFHFEKSFEKPEDRKGWSKTIFLRLLEVERAVFLSGYYKSLIIPFDGCGLCEECAVVREECKNPKMARPGADALGVDVFATARGIGYPIEVLRDYTETMNRYAFLLVE